MGKAVRTSLGKTIEVVAKTGRWEPITLGNHNYNLVNALAWMPGWSNSLPIGKYSARINFINVGVGQVGGQTLTITNATILRQQNASARTFVDFEVTSPGASISILVNGLNRGFTITGIITKGILEDGSF